MLVFRGFRALSRRVLKEDSQVQPLRIQKQEILSATEVAMILNRTLLAISWLLRLLIILSVINTIGPVRVDPRAGAAERGLFRGPG